MVKKLSENSGFHHAVDVSQVRKFGTYESRLYSFENFFHPFVGELIGKLNQTSVAQMMDRSFLQDLSTPFFNQDYTPLPSDTAKVISFDKKIDLYLSGPYANYNWELFFHIPIAIAVHLSKSQRFAEAQKWFHYVFDPTCTDTSESTPLRFWKSFVFGRYTFLENIDVLLRLLSTPDSELTNWQLQEKALILMSYAQIKQNPFKPHLIASGSGRQSAYQYYVVMKYLDNLIFWGDNLFLQNTIETINEATLCYVLAANLLGPRPQRLPPRGTVARKNFKQLKEVGLDPMSNALVDLEGQFPFNFAGSLPQDPSGKGPLFGIGRTLYFCIPHNAKLLKYWDTVADRLFKIRHCQNIQGIAQQLPLFDPPIDPGMLVKAAAAGIDIGSIVSGLNQPLGPVRSPMLIQKALELCGEVRSLGNALLSALEKGEAEKLASLRQGHELALHQATQDTRFLQWKHAEESTNALLKTRATALERYKYYLRLVGLTPDPSTVPDPITPDRRKLTEENFDDTYSALVGAYDRSVPLQAYPESRLAETASPSSQSGASSTGRLYLNVNEDAELNKHLPAARDYRIASSVCDLLASVLVFIPDFNVHLHFWGLGGSSKVFGGSTVSEASKIAAEILRTKAAWEQDQGGMAGRTAGYERRADEWMLQANLAARELMQIGRQIIGSLIAEQVTNHEFELAKKQVEQSQAVEDFLEDKFTNVDFYTWMQGEVSRLYYQYYRFAVEIARKAEQTMKRELMRPEFDATGFVQYNYWDTGRKGLLSGEALYLDVKRMEMAYHDNNKRELELTRHVSLRQLDPVALLNLKIAGSCTVTIPEWLYDLDCPGHYMRRIKSVALSIPSVVGPYTSVNCTLSLLKSSVRTSSIASDDYARKLSEPDDRFVDYFGSIQSVVTSSGNNDSGMFETNLRDERFLPFEGAGAISTWKLDLPADYRTFDYATISDVILHIRYTARQGMEPDKVTTALDNLFKEASQSNLALLFSLRHDFPTEWSAFVNGPSDFTATIRKDYFPYFAQGKTVNEGKTINVVGLDLYDGEDLTKHHAVGNEGDWNTATAELKEQSQFDLTTGPDTEPPQVLTRKARQVYLIIHYTIA